jgi:hypothetical protein
MSSHDTLFRAVVLNLENRFMRVRTGEIYQDRLNELAMVLVQATDPYTKFYHVMQKVANWEQDDQPLLPAVDDDLNSASSANASSLPDNLTDFQVVIRQGFINEGGFVPRDLPRESPPPHPTCADMSTEGRTGWRTVAAEAPAEPTAGPSTERRGADAGQDAAVSMASSYSDETGEMLLLCESCGKQPLAEMLGAECWDCYSEH